MRPAGKPTQVHKTGFLGTGEGLGLTPFGSLETVRGGVRGVFAGGVYGTLWTHGLLAEEELASIPDSPWPVG